MEIVLYGALVVLGFNFFHYLFRIIIKSDLEGNSLVLETTLGLVLLVSYLVLFSLRSSAPPLTSRNEIFVLFGCSIIAIYLSTLLTADLKAIGGLVLPVVLIFVVLSALQPLPANEITSSTSNGTVPWPHILFIVSAYGSFSTSFLFAVGYLRAERQLKQKSVGEFFFLLPSLEDLDSGLERSIWLGILLLIAGMSIALINGLYRGTLSLYWFRDPNVLGAVITGLIYGTIIYIRKRSLFTNRRIAFLAIFGFVFIGILFFSMNFFPRMHRFL